MPEEVKPVNLPFTPPNLVGTYKSAYTPPSSTEPTMSGLDIFHNLINQAAPKTGQDFPVVSAKDVDFTGRYPLFYPGLDNEEMYAKNQSSFQKAYNGVVKMAGTATSTFLEGTAGLVYGIGKSTSDGKFSSM